MTGYDEFERPFEVEKNAELSRLTDLPAWKEPEYPDMERRETEQPYDTTDFHVPAYTDREDWW